MVIRALAYSVDDLAWAREQFGTVHVELDPWGNLIVTPASDPHELAVAVLHAQLARQLDLPDYCIVVPGLAWRMPRGSGFTNVCDLMVLDPDFRRVDETHLDPPPLLVAEVASPSTRTIDRTRKLSDYRIGAAGVYLRIDVPGLSKAARCTAEIYESATPDSPATGLTGRVMIRVGTSQVVIDLDGLTGPAAR
jgi:Uma2 family endonuclease